VLVTDVPQKVQVPEFSTLSAFIGFLIKLRCCLDLLSWWLTHPVVAVCTTRFNIHKFYVLPTQCIYVFLCGSENKQRLFRCTALNGWVL